MSIDDYNQKINVMEQEELFKKLMSHPEIERAWETGGDVNWIEGNPPIFKTTVHVLLKSGGRKEFPSIEEAIKDLK